jgi:hypothetical protein
MTQSLNFEDYSATLAVRFPGVPALNVEGHMATLYLYRTPNFICSQKVRAVLAATGSTTMPTRRRSSPQVEERQ